jgi:hypothetical protein
LVVGLATMAPTLAVNISAAIKRAMRWVNMIFPFGLPELLRVA